MNYKTMMALQKVAAGLRKVADEGAPLPPYEPDPKLTIASVFNNDGNYHKHTPRPAEGTRTPTAYFNWLRSGLKKPPAKTDLQPTTGENGKNLLDQKIYPVGLTADPNKELTDAIRVERRRQITQFLNNNNIDPNSKQGEYIRRYLNNAGDLNMVRFNVGYPATAPTRTHMRYTDSYKYIDPKIRPAVVEQGFVMADNRNSPAARQPGRNQNLQLG